LRAWLLRCTITYPDQVRWTTAQRGAMITSGGDRSNNPAKGIWEAMRLILNIIWLVLCGFWMAIGYVVAGIICCILIITIPWGLAAFRIANYALWPFGRTIVSKPTSGAMSFAGNVIWFIVAGLWLAIGHAVTGVALALTIIGIPLALANFKMIPVSLAPLGKEIVSSREADYRYATR
jgi:uncharacterized membrane protein YccF (DUF307 family)